jgi:hypothetical protein
MSNGFLEFSFELLIADTGQIAAQCPQDAPANTCDDGMLAGADYCGG